MPLIKLIKMTKNNKLFQIDLPYACFGIEVKDNKKIINAAPIGKWMIGKDLHKITIWVAKKGGKIKQVK